MKIVFRPICLKLNFTSQVMIGVFIFPAPKRVSKIESVGTASEFYLTGSGKTLELK